MASTFEHDARLILSDRHGRYIPQLFCEDITEEEAVRLKVDWKDVLCCQSGPDEEWYWEAWQCITDNLRFTDSKGKVWMIYQDGDLWEIPEDCEIPEMF